MSGELFKTFSPLTKTIDTTVRKTGYDKSFVSAAKLHVATLLASSGKEEDLRTKEEMCNILISKIFLDKIYDMHPTQRFKCHVNENSKWPIPPLPSEAFGSVKPSDEFRAEAFYQCLKVQDILDCRVSSVLPSEYQLRVIHKFGVSRMVDDLNLIVSLYRSKNELNILKNDLLMYELVRVAVVTYKRSGNDANIVVTVDPDSIVFASDIPKLGRIVDSDLPSYVLDLPDTKKYPVYADYLSAKTKFLNPTFTDNLFSGFGVNVKAVHSYYPEFNGKECSHEFCGQYLLTEAKSSDAGALAKSALLEKEKKNFKESLNIIQKALEICPEKDKCRLYEIKSEILAAEKKPEYSADAAMALEEAYYADPNDENVTKKFAHYIYKSANRYYRAKLYNKSAVALEQTVKLDPDNQLAVTLLSHIKKKHSDKLENYDEKSLLDLHGKKKELEKELKKISQ